MALNYDPEQLMSFLDEAVKLMDAFTDAVTKWDTLLAEYYRNGIGDLTQEDLLASKYKNRTPAQFTTAIGATAAEIALLKNTQLHPDLDAHVGQIETFANRR